MCGVGGAGVVVYIVCVYVHIGLRHVADVPVCELVIVCVHVWVFAWCWYLRGGKRGACEWEVSLLHAWAYPALFWGGWRFSFSFIFEIQMCSFLFLKPTGGHYLKGY